MSILLSLWGSQEKMSEEKEVRYSTVVFLAVTNGGVVEGFWCTADWDELWFLYLRYRN
jgi:hypothetical protein